MPTSSHPLNRHACQSNIDNTYMQYFLVYYIYYSTFAARPGIEGTTERCFASSTALAALGPGHVAT
jgi:hypothetical protein